MTARRGTVVRASTHLHGHTVGTATSRQPVALRSPRARDAQVDRARHLCDQREDGNITVGPRVRSVHRSGGTIEEQTAGTIENLRLILEEAGSSLDRVVWIQVGLADPSEYARMNAEYIKHFPEDKRPARATVKLGFESPNGKLVMACTALAGKGDR